MVHDHCVCDFTDYFDLNEQAREVEDKGDTLRVTGHFNSNGGYCCPHYGNTCGSHQEYNRQDLQPPLFELEKGE